MYIAKKEGGGCIRTPPPLLNYQIALTSTERWGGVPMSAQLGLTSSIATNALDSAGRKFPSPRDFFPFFLFSSSLMSLSLSLSCIFSCFFFRGGSHRPGPEWLPEWLCSPPARAEGPSKGTSGIWGTTQGRHVQMYVLLCFMGLVLSCLVWRRTSCSQDQPHVRLLWLCLAHTAVQHVCEC